MNYFLVTTIAVLACTSLACSSAEPQSAPTHHPAVADGAPSKFIHISDPPRIQPPKGQLPPVLVLLHGYKSMIKDVHWITENMDGRFHCLSIQGNFKVPNDDYGWYSLEGRDWPGYGFDPPGAEQAVHDVAQFVRECADHYGFDKQRVYYVGFSQGGMMSLDLGLLHPEATAGIVSISGCLRDSSIAHITNKPALKDKPMLLLHGTSDDVILFRFYHEAIAALEGVGVAVSRQEFDAGHTYTPAMVEHARKWLAKELDDWEKR